MLTRRQTEIMELVSLGYSVSGIMEKLEITKACVISHMNNIYKAFGLKKEKDKCVKVLAIRKFKGLDNDGM